ncbi:MAG: phosphatidate cytidylyltransferase [Lachnospiraceae bacterium]|nr:phosphatidate cytidylyltransferase [Candidatus Colinaster equi]
MRTRIISGTVIAAVLFCVFFIGGYALGAFCFAIAMIAYYELTKACGVCNNEKKIGLLQIAGFAVIAAYYVILLMKVNVDVMFCALIAVIFIIAELIIYVFSFPKYKASQVFAAIFSVIYAPLLISFLYLIDASSEYGIYFLLLVLGASAGCDVAAYFVGVTLGKHKMTPILSPKKTIEGGIGGLLGAAVCSTIIGIVMYANGIGDVTLIVKCALIGLIGGVLSEIGDLAASGIKREFGIKDYGNLIPGHGGIMDRVDSIIVVAPFVYFAINMFI